MRQIKAFVAPAVIMPMVDKGMAMIDLADKPEHFSDVFRAALDALGEPADDDGLTLVSIEPTAAMNEAGARAGRVSARLAAKIYRAMLKAASD